MSTWKIFRLLLPLLIIGFVVPMILPGKDGQPIMSWQDWLPKASTLESVKTSVAKVANSAAELVGEEKPFTLPSQDLYKWQDPQGRWQFTDDPKKIPDYALSQFQSEAMPKVVNSMAPPPLMPEEESAAIPGAGLVGSDGIQLEKMPQLIDEAKKVREQLERRNQELEQF